jgi:hypothetical protein
VRWNTGSTKLPPIVVAGFGIFSKLLAAVALITVLKNYFALDIHISHVRPLVDVQLIVLDNMPNFSIANLLKFAGDFLCSLC